MCLLNVMERVFLSTTYGIVVSECEYYTSHHDRLLSSLGPLFYKFDPTVGFIVLLRLLLHLLLICDTLFGIVFNATVYDFRH